MSAPQPIRWGKRKALRWGPQAAPVRPDDTRALELALSALRNMETQDGAPVFALTPEQARDVADWRATWSPHWWLP